MDQSKKTMRHFYCRDVLWETFEQMANDFDCSIDYLINEAMRFYARSKNYNAGAAPPSSPTVPQQAARAAERADRWAATTPATRPRRRAGASADAAAGARRRRASAAGAQTRAAPGRAAGAAAASGARHAGAADTCAAHHARSRRTARRRSLFLVFNNQRIPIDKDQFIIGRGSKSSDLAIKDGNISRKHAAVIRRNGMFYIKDLGSTNGIDYKGMRIDNKRIDEGDIFHICDYELRFTYR